MTLTICFLTFGLTFIQFMILLWIFFFFVRGFYKTGNIVAAISAFTAAIVLDDSIPSYPLIFLVLCGPLYVVMLFLKEFKVEMSS